MGSNKSTGYYIFRIISYLYNGKDIKTKMELDGNFNEM